MKLSDHYRQNYCDIYPQVRNKRSLHIGSKLYVLFLTVLATSAMSYIK